MHFCGQELAFLGSIWPSIRYLGLVVRCLFSAHPKDRITNCAEAARGRVKVYTRCRLCGERWALQLGPRRILQWRQEQR